jgi:hypothetical protein
MFYFEKEIADITILHEGFNLSQLWLLREELNSIIEDLEELKQLAISIRDKKELRETEEKLFFLNRNVNIIEETMIDKENEIFEFLICDEFCLN